MDMFKQEDVMIYSEEETSTRQTYDEVVKDLIMDEKQYLRDLHMITKVWVYFRTFCTRPIFEIISNKFIAFTTSAWKNS